MKKILIFRIIVIALYVLASFASTARTVSDASYGTSVLVKESIMLNLFRHERTVYVKAQDKTNNRDIPIENVLKEQLSRKGVVVVDTPQKAGWIIQADVKSLEHSKINPLKRDAKRWGLQAQSIVNALIPGNYDDSWILAIAGHITASVAAMAAGSIVRIEEYRAVVDVLILERDAESGYRTYGTSLSILVREKNIDCGEAAAEIASKAAERIAGLF